MLDLHALGGLTLGGAESVQPKRLALLCYLTLAKPDGFHRRDSLVALFWPELDEAHARQSLRQALTALRTLDERLVVARGDEEVGIAPGALACDVLAFEHAVAQGELAAALECYSGPFLDGFFLDDCPEFERWVEAERTRLSGLAAGAAWELAGREQVPAAAVRWARRAAGLQPDDEGALRRLVSVLDRAGDRAGALREYEAFARRLREQYQAEPAPETQALLAAVRLRCERSAAPPTADSARTLGHSASPMSAPHQQRLARSTVGRRLLAVVVVVAAGIGLWLRHIHRAATPAPPSPDRVAVFPFATQPSPGYEHLGEAVMDLLGDAVDGVGDLRRVDPATVIGQLRRDSIHLVDPSAGAQLARKVGAGRFIVGTVTPVGNQIRLSASLYELTNGPDPSSRSVQQGSEETLSGLVEQLASELLRSLSLGPGARLEHIATVHAANYAALKAYLEAERYLRRAQEDSAKPLLFRAVSLDSTFALAWYRLAWAQDFTSDYRMGRSVEEAYRFRDRLSQRDQLLAQVARAYAHGNEVQEDSLALVTVGKYPDEVEAWWLLGMARLWGHWKWGRSPLEGLAPLERAVQLDPGHRYALYNATWARMYQGNYAGADSLGTLAMAHGAESSSYRLLRHFIRVCREGDQRAQDSLLREMATRSDGPIARWGSGVIRFSDELAAGRRVFQLLLDPGRRAPETRGLGHALIALVNLSGGRWDEGQREFALGLEGEAGLANAYRAYFAAAPFFDRPSTEVLALRDSLEHWQASSPRWQARPGDPSTWIYGQPPELRDQFLTYLRGLLSARAGDGANAEVQARRLERAREPGDSAGLLLDLALEIRALAAFEQGQSQEALMILERMTMRTTWHYQQYASPFYLRPLARFLRAESLYRLGRLHEALGWYWFAVLSVPETVFLAPAYLRSGEIYEKLVDRSQALEYYRRFVARWRDADQRYQPLVRDVQARISRLSRGGGN